MQIAPDIKETILKCWERYKIKPEDGWELRRRFITDGLWAAKELLGYKEFADCHKEVFDFFVPKDPDALDFKTFAESYTGLHDDLLMLCRGGFKSTADIVDCIQWIVCFPDIRINIMTGTAPLAEEFVDLITGHFRCNKDGSPALGVDGKPRLFQILFPEHCEHRIAKGEWITPARRCQVAGPTIRATSVESNSTGTHCDILKLDDVTTAANTNTASAIKSVNRFIAQARKLVEPYGFKTRIGTPYDLQDNLSSTVEDEAKRAAKGQPSLVKVLRRPALTRKPGYEDTAFDQLKEEMVDLWFPERISLKFLQAEYAESLKTDPKEFYSQYLLDLKAANFQKYSRDALVAATVPFTAIQPYIDGQIFQSWDTAYGSSYNNADYSVGLTGLFFAGRVYLLDMCRGHFNEDELPRMIAEFAFKWHPERIAIEDSTGVRWLKKEIAREMQRLRYNGPTVEMASLGFGSKQTNKVNRAQPGVRLLADKRLVISNELAQLDAFYDELEAFPPKAGGHDDIVDALSQLVNYFYQASEFEEAVNAGVERFDDADDGWYRLIHGMDVQPEPQQPQVSIDDDFQELFQ